MSETEPTIDHMTPAARRELLAKMLAEKAARPRPVPASYAQRRFWFLSQFEPGLPVYNLPAVYRLQGQLNLDALDASLQALIQRHEALRTTFRQQDNEPMQVIQPTMALAIARYNSAESNLVKKLIETPFDLEEGPLLRVALLATGPEAHLLVVVIHHIVADGWSMGIFMRELFALYDGFVSGRPLTLPPLARQYADVSRQQRELVNDARLRAQLEYWLAQLANANYTLNLPTDRPRPQQTTYLGSRQYQSISAAETAALTTLSQQERVTLFMLLLSAFAVLLHRYTEHDDLLIGTPIAGRRREEDEGLIGIFLNTLILRLRFDEKPTFRQLLRQVRQTALAAYDNQDIPFEKVVDELNPPRDISSPPIFQAMFSLQNTPTADIEVQHLHVTQVDGYTQTAKLDLSLYVFAEPDGLRATWEFNTALFDPATIERMQNHFAVILRHLLADPDRPVGDFALLTAAERQQLADWNDTAAPPPPEPTIAAAFAAQAARTPDAVAVQTTASAVTYRQLADQANRLAHHLAALGVSPGDFVGICLPRSPAMVAALLAVLTAGGAYLPLDPTYPPDRLRLMIEDSGTKFVIVNADTAGLLPAGAVRQINLAVDQTEIAAQPATAPKTAPNDVAYLMYTSGSTGRPKGVLGTQRGALNRMAWMWRQYPFATGERSCQKTSLSFVDSVWEIFGPLLQGVPALLIPDDVVKDPRRLLTLLDEYAVTRIVLVPSLLNALLAATNDLAGRLPHLKTWITSGETLSPQLAAAFRAQMPAARLINLYGSSEVAGDVTCFDLTAAGWTADQGDVPIGRPIDNTYLRLLDRHGQPVPAGIPGEIYAGGANVAQGYVGRPALTAARFVPDPLQPGAILFKTGDLGLYRPDGHIRFLGRRDYQVKVRGYRIELGEIEAALRENPAVDEAVVILPPDADAPLAYVVTTSDVTTADLRRYLEARLPDYMLPSGFVNLDRFPLTPSGKINRLALPDPDSSRPDVSADYAAPASAAETIVAQVWRDMLNLEQVGRHDNFFELGGHSLLAMQLTFRLQERFRVELPLPDFFAAPSVAGIVAQLGQIWGDPAIVEEIAQTWQELEAMEGDG